jgi:hypothetical protein
MKSLIAVAFALLFLALPAFAKPPAPAVGKLQPDEFAAVAARIRGEFGRGGRYEELSKRERRQVDDGLKAIERLLDGRESIDELNEEQVIELYNAQQLVNTTLARRDRLREVCERHTMLGSHFNKVRCETVADREIRTHQVRTMLEFRNDVHARGGGIEGASGE